MADVFTKEKRSEVMRAVRGSRNKSTELRLISFFKEQKIIGWRRNFKLLGKPDFVFAKQRIVVFVDGCFWHGHTCRNTTPKNNADFWFRKISRNKMRDKEVNHSLKGSGWRVIRVWECCLKNEKRLKTIFKDLLT